MHTQCPSILIVVVQERVRWSNALFSMPKSVCFSFTSAITRVVNSGSTNDGDGRNHFAREEFGRISLACFVCCSGGVVLVLGGTCSFT